jgi:hypothetical protein
MSAKEASMLRVVAFNREAAKCLIARSDQERELLKFIRTFHVDDQRGIVRYVKALMKFRDSLANYFKKHPEAALRWINSQKGGV